MDTFSNRLKSARKSTGITQADLAKQVGVSQATIANIENGRNKASTEVLSLAKILCVSPDWLATGKGSRELANTSSAPPLSTVPLISWVAAGFWADVIDNNPAGQGEAISTSYQARRHTFALRVQGDSMEPRFPEGCIIIVEPDEQAAPGKFVVVRQNGDSEATFKQLIQDGGTLYLKPLNARYPIMPMRSDAVIAGVVKRMEMDI